MSNPPTIARGSMYHNWSSLISSRGPSLPPDYTEEVGTDDTEEELLEDKVDYLKQLLNHKCKLVRKQELKIDALRLLFKNLNEQHDAYTKLGSETIQLYKSEIDLHENYISNADKKIKQLMKRVDTLDTSLHLQKAKTENYKKMTDELEVQVHKHKKRLICSVCHMNERTLLFNPCHHLLSCAECFENLVVKQCPTCRQDIESVVNIYVS